MNESEKELLKLKGVLGRRYWVWQGEGISQTERKGTYIWGDVDGYDEEKRERYEEIEWQEEYKRRCLENMNK
jgi:hypothetical protein